MRIYAILVTSLLTLALVLGQRDGQKERSESSRKSERVRANKGNAKEKKGCAAVKQAWGQQNLGNAKVPGTMMDGTSSLRVCTPKQNRTCCTSEMEEKLVSRSRRDYDRVTGDKLNQLKIKLSTQANQFRGVCLDLISNSSRDLHEMFTKTYGVIYEQNSAVFSALFSDFHRYYRGTDLSLTEALDRFFQNLLQKVFLLLNAHYTFDDSYMHCVARHADQLQPFGDVPRKLSVHLNRAFVAARTFLQGLLAGANIASSAAKIEPNVECGKAITRMLHCPYCSGLMNIAPCRTYCNNVMRGCMAQHTQLNEAWASYIEAMEQLSGRLETSFSMDSVLDPLEVKISDAIMNVQENSESVTSKIFQLCGQPSLGSRSRRDLGADAGVRQLLRHRRLSREHYAPPTSPPPYAGSPLSRAVLEAKQAMIGVTNFWLRLPDDVCLNVAPTEGDKKCWNGQTKGRYENSLVGVGLMNQTENKEVVVDTQHRDPTVNNLIQKLRQITNKLRQAHSGQDVKWMYGDDVDNRRQNNDDEDDDDDDDDEMSGMSLPERYQPPRQSIRINPPYIGGEGGDSHFAPFTPPWMATTRVHYPQQNNGWRPYDVTAPPAKNHNARYIDSYNGSSSQLRSIVSLYVFTLSLVFSTISSFLLRLAAS